MSGRKKYWQKQLTNIEEKQRTNRREDGRKTCQKSTGKAPSKIGQEIE